MPGMHSTCHTSSQRPLRFAPSTGVVLPFGLGVRPAAATRPLRANAARSLKAAAAPPAPSRNDWIKFSPATGVVPDDAGLRFTAADTARAAKALEAHLARANPKTGEGQPSAGKAKAPSNQLADAAPS